MNFVVQITSTPRYIVNVILSSESVGLENCIPVWWIHLNFQFVFQNYQIISIPEAFGHLSVAGRISISQLTNILLRNPWKMDWNSEITLDRFNKNLNKLLVKLHNELINGTCKTERRSRERRVSRSTCDKV